ncbi:MAG: 2-octaprenyl-3-methyl-6-methoxy-1,4-benzoquinol hydroxylase [Woeseia sp.]|nr:FAD-dependent monooxygenase [Woeseia sp.]MBT8097286.1 FAD-dependent monooxygenase [Woeseia sp.]NNE61136.1 2-octaprenyl-3-methyl-6-methoxy-1,4-benzoquinol hydroxylase [Woeseia sp.]NNL54429.1 2-octaprenyl-3-methyl-6-methoxy-1,4-benzoquinol hydroxylase [Woeseia sp.]
MNRNCDIVIAGAGVVGLAMTALLARLPQSARLTITLVDAMPPPPANAGDEIGLRVSAIAAGTMAMFTELGIADPAAVRACPYRDMRVWDAEADALGPEALHFAASEVALGQLGFITEDALLRHRLYADLEEQAVDLRFGSGIEKLERAGNAIELTLNDDTALRADLLVAADGARSRVRDLAGIDVKSWEYAQSALVTHAQPSRSHQHTAWQRFLSDGPIALLPLLDGRVSIVWSTSPAKVADLLAADDATLGQELTEASDAILGDLQVAAPRASFPLRAQHAKQYVQHGIALIGDAAHTVHPLAGQGANLGLADAAALARVIELAMDAEEWPGDVSVLRRYERERRGANSAMLHFIDELNRLFAAGASFSGLRGAGMRLFNRSGPLKRRAMQVAIGL